MAKLVCMKEWFWEAFFHHSIIVSKRIPHEEKEEGERERGERDRRERRRGREREGRKRDRGREGSKMCIIIKWKWKCWLLRNQKFGSKSNTPHLYSLVIFRGGPLVGPSLKIRFKLNRQYMRLNQVSSEFPCSMGRGQKYLIFKLEMLKPFGKF